MWFLKMKPCNAPHPNIYHKYTSLKISLKHLMSILYNIYMPSRALDRPLPFDTKRKYNSVYCNCNAVWFQYDVYCRLNLYCVTILYINITYKHNNKEAFKFSFVNKVILIIKLITHDRFKLETGYFIRDSRNVSLDKRRYQMRYSLMWTENKSWMYVLIWF